MVLVCSQQMSLRHISNGKTCSGPMLGTLSPFALAPRTLGLLQPPPTVPLCYALGFGRCLPDLRCLTLSSAKASFHGHCCCLGCCQRPLVLLISLCSDSLLSGFETSGTAHCFSVGLSGLCSKFLGTCRLYQCLRTVK